MTTEEGNKLIAEFMGGTHKTVSFKTPYGEESYEEWEGVEGVPPRTGWAIVSSGDYPYNESWDWLMPVVEKIEQLKGSDDCYLFCVRMGKDFCVITYNSITSDIIGVESVFNNKIKSTWQAVVEFIKWYNKQPKPTEK